MPSSELDDAGLVAHNVLFDPDDLALALVDLDRRYAAGEGAEHADVINALAEGYAAMNRRDLDAWAAIHTPGHTSHDHSLIGFGEIGMQTYRDYLLAALEQVPDLQFVPATLEIDALVALVTIPVRGATPTGFEFERDLVVVTRFDDDLRITEDHFFSGEQWSEARELFEAFAAATNLEPRTTLVENVATRLMARVPELARTRQFESIADLIAADYVRIDHRTGIPAPTSHGPADFVAMLRATLDVGFDEILNTPLAVRGERLALSRVDVRAADGREIVFLQLHEWDASKLVYAADYDESALTDALAELEERFIAGEGAEHEYEIRRVGDVARATGRDPRRRVPRAAHAGMHRHRPPAPELADIHRVRRRRRGTRRPRAFRAPDHRVRIARDPRRCRARHPGRFLRHARGQRVPQAVPRRGALGRGAHRHARVLRTRAARRRA